MGKTPIAVSVFFGHEISDLGLRQAALRRVVCRSAAPSIHHMATRKFLVIDDNHDSRFLLTKTLLRKFPQAIVQECQDSEAANAEARNGQIDAIIAHRTADMDGLSLIRYLRQANPTIPIVMVSGIDRTVEALAAGATEFLSYDQWQRIGSVVAARFLAASPTPDWR